MKTYSAKPQDVTRKWYVIDASDTTLGRLSTKIATLLMGKQKPMYTAHTDCGDYVIVVNAKNLKVSGNKAEKKIYYRHTGHPGGIKDATLAEKLEKDPTEVIELAVRGMLPANKLRQDRLARLKVYSETDHNHAAQKPEQISLKGDK